MPHQVLVVGAGPVGMTLASELARYGVPVRIVDQATERTDKSKALVLWSRTLELLDRGGGGSAPFVAVGFKAEAVNIVAGDRAIGRVGMGGVRSPHPYALMLPQSETERLLEERLAGQGVAVERRVELRGRDAGQRLDAGGRAHARLPVPGQRGRGALAPGRRPRRLPDLPGPLPGDRGPAALRRRAPALADAGAGAGGDGPARPPRPRGPPPRPGPRASGQRPQGGEVTLG